MLRLSTINLLLVGILLLNLFMLGTSRIRALIQAVKIPVVGCRAPTGIGAVINTARVEPGSTALVVGLGEGFPERGQGAEPKGNGRARKRPCSRHAVDEDVIERDDAPALVISNGDGVLIDADVDGPARVLLA